MNKENKLKKLSKILDFETEYIDETGKKNKLKTEDISAILKVYGIDFQSEENFEEIISELEAEEFKNMLPSVKIIKKSQKPSVEISVNIENINMTYGWSLEKEDGTVHFGDFIPKRNYTKITKINNKSYTRFKFNIPLKIEQGYHTFKINSPDGKVFCTKVIIVPEKCYIPRIIAKNKKIFGPKIYLSKINLKNGNGIADFKNLKNIIKVLSNYNADIVGVGVINQTAVDKNLYLPSTRMFFNTLFLNMEDMLKFVEDKKLQIKLLSREFQKRNEELEKAKSTDYKAVFDIKFEKYKLIYQSFRELHMKNNTHKAQMFYSFMGQNGEKLHKLAVFRALQDFLASEDSRYFNLTEWPASYQNPASDFVMQFEKNNNELIEFYKFLQWQAYIQLEEAGATSYEKKLGIGIYADFPFCVDLNSSENWAYKEYFLNDIVIEIPTEDEQEKIYSSVLNPRKLYKSAYSYFVDIIRPNMVCAGALNLLDLEYILNPVCEINTDNTTKKISINYSLNDFLGIIALESHRNKCMVFVNSNSVPEKYSKILNKFGVFDEKKIDLKEITNEIQLKEYYENFKYSKSAYLKIKKTSTVNNDKIKIPNSTYRLQLNKNFGFEKAKSIIPHLKKLGISHVYSSPLLSPVKGSLHGYDIVNYNKINQEAGTFEEFESFVDELHNNGLGLILDIVPNHMGIGKENKWWMDVLENGQSSQYAHYFDIDWNPLKKELKGKVLIPLLGDHYGNVLADGQINFSFDSEKGKISTNYYEHEFPLNPSTYPIILEHRIEVLKTRLGNTNKDFQEYLSIITVFKNLPLHTNTDYEKITERIREKNIAFKRLASLCFVNEVIKGFIEENLIDFKCFADNEVSIERVHNLLEAQPYRLAFWRVSADEINYRRFFDINDLAATCVENPDVFTATHSFILNLIENKKIDGLRIDHPDGLLEPTKFYKKLQFEISKRLGIEFNQNEDDLLSSDKLPFYIVAEKILSSFEQLPSNWAIHGTVGYDFLNSVNGLFIKSENKNEFTYFYYKFIEQKINFDEMVIECKKLIMNTALAAELNVLSNYLNQISEKYLFSRDYTLNSLRNALIEVIACFQIYRTYISSEENGIKSKNYIKWAIGLAKKRSLATDISIFDFIEKVLLLELEKNLNSEKYQNILKFVLKFQQYTGPLMAKGFEDTFFYRYNRLLSLNEVGGNPNKFGISVEEFHQQNLNRMEITKNSMLSTSTHDTKRSEDIRSRICAISEFPLEWQKSVRKWHSINKLKKNSPSESIIIDKNDEYLIYQSLIGLFSTEELINGKMQDLSDRLENYILKAVREAKMHTSWVNINTEYEQALSNFIKRIFNYPPYHPFWESFQYFESLITNIGYLNSIFQCILKLTSPGVPDIYQGNEIYKFCLVDPDNRQPVDYQKIDECFDKITSLIEFNPDSDNYELFNEILLPFESSAIKLFYTSSILNFRNQNPDLFKSGKYIPLKVFGKNSNHFMAFARVLKNQALIIIVPRLMRNLISTENPLQIIQEEIEDTIIEIPKELKNFKWNDICTKQILPDFKEKIFIAKVLNILPASVLYGVKNL